MFVKPREGYLVRDPTHFRALPPEGAHVPDSMYWFQRVRDGDAIECEPPATEPEAKPIDAPKE